jgi:hypothetical protein
VHARVRLTSAFAAHVAPATHILDRWFESEILKTTLATDAVIGATGSPTHPGSAYLLLHHVMGEAAGRKGVWSYVEGGMGAISEAIAAAARAHGAEIAVNATVAKILYSGGGGASGGALATARGVRMADGTEVIAKKAVLVGCTPYHAFLELLPGVCVCAGMTACVCVRVRVCVTACVRVCAFVFCLYVATLLTASYAMVLQASRGTRARTRRAHCRAIFNTTFGSTSRVRARPRVCLRALSGRYYC